MRPILCSLCWTVVTMLGAVAPAPRQATVDPPPGSWITGVDGLREVRVTFDGPVDIPRDPVIVRSAGRRLVTNFRLIGAPCPAGLTTSPGEVRFGRADFSSVPMIDVLMITVQTNRALDANGVIELLSESGLEP